ncbi:MAG: hypothetical protein MUC50_10245 [Myxococcota bacterium]|jgi:hypothetical protein|nr:hypothetical protein [Myxococcota bacterium]
MKRQYKVSLSLEDLKNRIVATFEAKHRRFGQHRPSLDWTARNQALLNFRFMGVEVGVTLTLGNGLLDIDARVPLRLVAFFPLAARAVEEEISNWKVKPHQ